MLNPKILLTLLFALLFICCNHTKKFAKNAWPDSFPSDLTNENYVLLIQKRGTNTKETRWDIHENKLAEKVMKKYYKGRYELAFEKDIKSDPKYADTTVYRYVYNRSDAAKSSSISYTTPLGVNPNAPGMTHTRNYNDDFLYDRKESKQLPSTNLSSSSFAQGVMIFAKVASYKAK